jgi:hypothetical protein
MLEERVKQLQNHVDRNFSYNKSLNRRLHTFRRKEAAKMETAEKEAAEDNGDEEEDQHALLPGSSDDDGPINPFRFPRVKRWLKSPICLNYLYEHKNGLLLHIESFIKVEMSPPTWLNNISIFLGCSIYNMSDP